MVRSSVLGVGLHLDLKKPGLGFAPAYTCGGGGSIPCWNPGWVASDGAFLWQIWRWPGVECACGSVRSKVRPSEAMAGTQET